MTIKAVILIGGPQKGTRFRPLSLDLPKPLFPIAGMPMIKHQIDACRKLPNLKEIYFMGFYEEAEFAAFMSEEAEKDPTIKIAYLKETQALGTAGGLWHYRDAFLAGEPEAIFVLHADVCSTFPLSELLEFHRSKKSGTNHFTMMATTVEKQRAHMYGCIVVNPETNEVQHYAEKPETFVSDVINSGVYVFTPHLFDLIKSITGRSRTISIGNNIEDDEAPKNNESLSLERDVLGPLAGSGRLFAFMCKDFWTAVKTSGSALYANRCYLSNMRKSDPSLLAPITKTSSGPLIVGDVIIDKTAIVDPTCKIGPNVTIGPGAKIAAGVRIVDSIILSNVEIKSHACIIHSVIGWDSIIGAWARVEGVPGLPGTGNQYVDGKKNNGVTILGRGVEVAAEIIVRNCIVLPHKSLASSQRNEILL